MPEADAVMISSYEERKAAILRAAALINCSRGSDEEREFEMLTQAIAEFDIVQAAQSPIEIPPAFMQFIRGAGRRQVATKAS
ncbi:hypothetical protein [Bosea sp. BK604]|uniref:hypothetical protein n=1 Tax=Bosea sp. BK604 TaxID=2512180 RepID=UPI00104493D1|nr:hypothetical protein [Bosea sp. BK604]TCR67401.1 hypothetical protein EV560_103461 [Bosea sp. BK604]